jgi:hypothetical protein
MGTSLWVVLDGLHHASTVAHTAAVEQQHCCSSVTAAERNSWQPTWVVQAVLLLCFAFHGQQLLLIHRRPSVSCDRFWKVVWFNNLVPSNLQVAPTWQVLVGWNLV